ncbi:MAG: hypothetical protein E7478_04150 [Ruminococcaceae bacterium]|nr:hypothetical protein [Oscillospiraceae bacterium]
MNNEKEQKLLADMAEQLQLLIELRDATYKELDSIRNQQSNTTESKQQNIRRCYSEKKNRIVRYIINRYKAYIYVSDDCCAEEIIRSFTTIAMSLEDDFKIGSLVNYFKRTAEISNLEFNVTESPYGKSINRKRYNALFDSYYITPLVL